MYRRTRYTIHDQFPPPWSVFTVRTGFATASFILGRETVSAEFSLSIGFRRREVLLNLVAKLVDVSRIGPKGNRICFSFRPWAEQWLSTVG
jgi:hypothetical protein